MRGIIGRTKLALLNFIFIFLLVFAVRANAQVVIEAAVLVGIGGLLPTQENRAISGDGGQTAGDAWG